MLEGEETIQEYVEKRGKDGTPIPCILTARLFRDGDNNVLGVVEDSKDITERKRAEEALRESQGKLYVEHDKMKQLLKELAISKREWEETMDCMEHMVLLTDGKGRIKKSNKALDEFAGKESGDLFNREWRELLAELQIEADPVPGRSTEIYHKPSSRWFVLNSYPFRSMVGHGARTVITILDVTGLKLMSQGQEGKTLATNKNS